MRKSATIVLATGLLIANLETLALPILDWSKVPLAGAFPSFSFVDPDLGTVTVQYSTDTEKAGISNQYHRPTLIVGNTGGEQVSVSWSTPVTVLNFDLYDVDAGATGMSESVTIVSTAAEITVDEHPTDSYDPVTRTLSSDGTPNDNGEEGNFSIVTLTDPSGFTSFRLEWNVPVNTGSLGLGSMSLGRRFTEGRVVVSHDVNTLATSEARSNVEALFATDVARWLIGDRGGILALVSNANMSNRDYSQIVLDELMDSGYMVLESTNFSRTNFVHFDAIFTGIGFPMYETLDPDALAKYVKEGGNVYIFGGTGAPPRGPQEEADNLNDFLAPLGAFFKGGNIYNRIDDQVFITSTHPIFRNTTGEILKNGNGQSILLCDSFNVHPSCRVNKDAQVVQKFGDENVYAVIDPCVRKDVVNASVLHESTATFYNPSPLAQAPAGVFTIEATFLNDSGSDIDDPCFRVVELTGGNLLLNADGGSGGEGTTLRPDAANRLLRSGDRIAVSFQIGLQSLQRFNFFVDLHATD